jgi:hypothetical protein
MPFQALARGSLASCAGGVTTFSPSATAIRRPHASAPPKYAHSRAIVTPPGRHFGGLSCPGEDQNFDTSLFIVPDRILRVSCAVGQPGWASTGLLVLGDGTLQILLDKGQEDDWFGSSFIIALAVISAVCLVSLVLWELRTSSPVIDVRTYENFNFAVGNLMIFLLGMLLFASLVMMPQFLQTLMGYSAQSTGLVLSGASLIILLEMLIVGQLTTKVPAKYIMAFGWLCLACGMYYSTRGLELLISFAAASRLRMVQAFGLGFLFVPINLSAYVRVPRKRPPAYLAL